MRSDRTHRICENNRENRKSANQERAKTRGQGHVADPLQLTMPSTPKMRSFTVENPIFALPRLTLALTTSL